MKTTQHKATIPTKMPYRLWLILAITLFCTCNGKPLIAGSWWNCLCCCYADACCATEKESAQSKIELPEPSIIITVASKPRQATPQPQTPPLPKTFSMPETDYENLIIATIDNSLYFTCDRPCNQLRTFGTNQRAPLSLQALKADAVKKWYANNCSNPLLTRLVETAIKYINANEDQEHEKQPTPLTETTAIATGETKNAAKKPNLAIFDIDGTILTAYPAELTFAQTKEPLSEEQTNKILLNEITDIAPVHALYTYFQRRGYHIAFVSARSEPAREQTINQLVKMGYDVTNNNLFLRYFEQNSRIFKETIRKQLAKTFNIIAIVDDVYQNLRGNYIGRYNIWIPNLLESQEDEENFFTYLLEHSIFIQDQYFYQAF